MKRAMQNPRLQSALLRITTRERNLAVFQSLAFSPTPFADLMLHPEKLAAVEKVLEDCQGKEVSSPAAAKPRQPVRVAPPEKTEAQLAGCNPLSELIPTEFQLDAPGARSVQLAGDFTDWQAAPLDMIPAEDGTWFAIVPLAPGNYAYRFIVDGQWRDDPQPVRQVPNPFGTVNAVVTVT